MYRSFLESIEKKRGMLELTQCHIEKWKKDARFYESGYIN